MDEIIHELMDAPEITLNITEFNPEFIILNDRSDKSSSGVWKHFGAIKLNDAVDKKHVYCTHCFGNQRIKKYQRSTSTGNLSKHLRKQHNISLNQTFRVKKDPDNTIHLIKEDADESDVVDEGSDEFLVHDINEILISEVAKRPLLYNPQAVQEKGSKHTRRREQWEEVYGALNHLIPIAKLPKVWKNIRDRYHKVRRAASEHGDAKPKYRYYEHLRFLDSIIDDQHSTKYEQIEEEADVEEYLTISGDHDHYISSETIVLQNESVAYEEETTCEPVTKKQKLSPKKQQTTYKIITEEMKPGKNITISSSNIIEESYVNATSNDLFTSFEEELVTDDININKQSTLINQGTNIETISSVPVSNPAVKQDEFNFFGNFVAEVMRNMPKQKSRTLQMSIMTLIRDAENES
ncbi:uncharacterized protein LOC116343581 [Contarinia nasturtii]|uniref:uncharacterized protein LOC116343581 n=1 Tax=Contarinia nasturtii TaxID=265458 RepID=UPI0012D42053|nr:uncharacterized protein LOC116343581 [Contarinia nasturtii]